MTNRKRIKRYTWLFKNLTFPQMVKYITVKKPVYVYNQPEKYPQKSYTIDDSIAIDQFGTLLIKPSGMKKIDFIISEVKKSGVQIRNALEIEDYTLYADNVFITAEDKERKIWTEILRTYFPENYNVGVLLYLDKDLKSVATMKNNIRKKVGISFFRVVDGDNTWISGITPIHSSNSKERVREESVIRSMMAEGKVKVKEELIFCN